MKIFGQMVLIGSICVAINWLSLLIGWWWITSLVGLLFGVFIRRAGTSFLLSLCTGGLSWSLPLALLVATTPMRSVANTVSSVIGLPANDGLLIIVLTVVLGCILSVLGTWVGKTSVSVIFPYRR